jgi:ring-1,2-phenylacetyl-CoA epoxidase subunit PaaE
MSRFHSLKVIDVVKETADAVSVAFEVPAELKESFNYIQGQYLTLKFTVNGEELRRSYSICSSPAEDAPIRVAIKKVKGGRVSTFINDNVKVGDMVEMMPPMGNFHTEMKASNAKNYILFAGGSGITPMLSILKTALKSEPNSKTILFYANNDESSTIFKKQIDNLVAANSNNLTVHHILNNPPKAEAEKPKGLFAKMLSKAPVSNHPALLTGMMTQEKTSELVKTYVNTSADNEYFVCGPGPMMDNVAKALKGLKIDESRVHIEYFSTPDAAPVAQATTTQAATPRAGKAIATVILDKETHQIELKDAETILEAAMRIGLDPPYACQGGSCCTCRALLIEGEVKMAATYGLSASEIKDKYILTCQSTAVTDKVTVNYDKG